MSDAQVPHKPLLHPVLTLRKDAVKREATSGGKKEEDIVVTRLQRQRAALSLQVSNLRAAQQELPIFANQTLLVAEMFDDSFSFSKTPRDLFRGRDGSMLRGAATLSGYLVEADVREMGRLVRTITDGSAVATRCDISRVKTIRSYGESDIYRDRTEEALWSSAPEYERGRAFVIWLSPFRTLQARQALIETIEGLEKSNVMVPTSARMLLGPAARGDIVVSDPAPRQNSLAIAQREYRSVGHGRALVQIPSRNALRSIVASGGVFRLIQCSRLASRLREKDRSRARFRPLL